jgi:hypothetical protein
MRTTTLAIIGAAAVAAVSCSVHQADVPGLSGPSTLARSITMTVTPDRISRDGASQSSIAVSAFGPDGRPLAGQSIRLDMLVEGQLDDFGTLSARTLSTGQDGIAHAAYTAPIAAPPPGNTTVTTVSIQAVLIGQDAQTARPISADIRLMPVGIILPPGDTPTAQFTVTPTPMSFNVPATFDASASCGGSIVGSVCTSTSAITSYVWDFGDGHTVSGKTATHAYPPPSVPTPTVSFTVTLTVTNDRGLSASTSQAVSVNGAQPPTGDWVFSPTNPVPGTVVAFNANGIHAAAGHAITQYSWNFGDEASGASNVASGPLVTHSFTGSFNYQVVLTVVDETGATTVIPHTVSVAKP